MTVKAICWRKPDLGDTSKVGGLGYCLCEGSCSADTPWGTISTQIVCFDLMSSAAMENSIYLRVKWFFGAAWTERMPKRVSFLKPALEIPWEDVLVLHEIHFALLAEGVKDKCGNAIFSRSAAASAKATCPQSVTWECWKFRRNGILFQHHESSRIVCQPPNGSWVCYEASQRPEHHNYSSVQVFRAGSYWSLFSSFPSAIDDISKDLLKTFLLTYFY